MGVVAFEGDFAVWVGFAENVEIAKMPCAEEDLYLLGYTIVCLHFNFNL